MMREGGGGRRSLALTNRTRVPVQVRRLNLARRAGAEPFDFRCTVEQSSGQTLDWLDVCEGPRQPQHLAVGLN